jgi:CRP/FNR family transcriptional regulator
MELRICNSQKRPTTSGVDIMGSAHAIIKTAKVRPLGRAPCADACTRHNNCLLAKLATETRTRLEQHIGRPRILQRGQRLFTSGSVCDSLYLVNSGSFKAYVESENGEEQITAFHFTNDALGFDGLERGQHTYSVEALETASVCRISYETLHAVIGSDPELHLQLMKKISRQIGNEHMTIFMLARMSAEQRLAQFFLMLSVVMQECGCVADQINLSMPRNDIANYLGLALETVSRLLKRFQNCGLLKVAHRHVQLLDSAGLQIMAQYGDKLEKVQPSRRLIQETEARWILSSIQ